MSSAISPSPAASTVWDGIALLNAFEFASRWLERHREGVNALNVFPVPDGDTGTNMALTMRSAIDSARATPASRSIGNVAGAIAHGALMGARGNSGVILSQIFRGFASEIAEQDEMDGDALARALESASQMAYKAVLQPVEGTMLTVMRVAAERALASASDTSSSPQPVLRAALEGARLALAKTPEQLDILRQAGVVDSGGQGVVFILEGLFRYAQGDAFIEAGDGNVIITSGMRFLDGIAENNGDDPFGYCTNFMIFGKGMDFEHAREEMAAMGQSAVIVGDDSTIKVHIHTENPGRILEYAVTLGTLDQIKIENMTLQTAALMEQREHIESPHDDSGIPVVDGPIGIIAVAAGKGLSIALKSMGAHVIVSGGPTMNPSTEQLLEAVRLMPVDDVIILPNNKNIIMAAKQVGTLTDKAVRVVPSRSVPQGLAALARYSRDIPLDANIDRMTNALGDVQSVEITRAVRDVELNGVTVTTGDPIGLVGGDLVASGADVVDVVAHTLNTLDSNGPELLTIFTGADATPEATADIERIASEHFPDAEIEVVDGDQPHYPYLIAIE